MLDAFTWYKQSTFRWKGEKLVVYIDSWGLTDDLPPADLLLITHAHGDHFAPDDIARVKTNKTVIVAPHDVARELSGNVKPVKPKFAVPMHYGFYPGVGVAGDGERFKKAASPVEVKVFKPVHPFANT